MNMSTKTDESQLPLVFGIYPGGHSAMPPRIPDDNDLINQALTELQGTLERPFRVRKYMVYKDDLLEGRTLNDILMECGVRDNPLARGQLLDLVVAFQSKVGDVEGYQAFLQALVQAIGSELDTLQITEEPNAVNNGGYVDGDTPRVREALVAGMLTAKQEARRQGYGHLKIGFNVIPSFGDDFFESLRTIGGDEWIETVDYVGLDCFPGVWMMPDANPVELGKAIVSLIDWLRNDRLPQCGIPAGVPIIIAENGWATGLGRSPERQAEVLEEIIRAVDANRATYNVQGYTIFSLRDADSSNPDVFAQFGILYDDYSRKPAFEVFRKLIAELGSVA
jgi:hypothetical protein